jgi:hypothetical protein
MSYKYLWVLMSTFRYSKDLDPWWVTHDIQVPDPWVQVMSWVKLTRIQVQVCKYKILMSLSLSNSWVHSWHALHNIETVQWGLVLPQLSSAFFRLFCGFFVTENAVIDVMMRKKLTNIAPLHTFQIKKKLFKYMQPILKYSKNNMWFFWMPHIS